MYLMTCTCLDLAYPLSLLSRYVAPGFSGTHRTLRRFLGQRPGDSAFVTGCEAEIYAGAMAAQELHWVTYLLTDLGEWPGSPPVLYVDNKAMLALCHEQRLEHRTKHIALRYFLAREMQQRHQLRLSYVESRSNTADVFTKALGTGDHQRFCTALGLVPNLLCGVLEIHPELFFVLFSCLTGLVTVCCVCYLPLSLWGPAYRATADDDVQDAEEGWRVEGDAGAKGGTVADTEAATETGTAEDVFPEGAPGGDDDDVVEYWSRDGLPEKLPIPTYPPRNRKRPHPSPQNRDSHPPSPRHKPNDHKRQAYTAAEKLKWVAQLDVAVSVRALARESGIHRKCLANWKRAADFLKEAHSARKRMHGRGRASWYRPMEIKVYERLLDWQRKGTAVSVGCLQEWYREFMKFLYPLVKWKGSQRWSDR
ncbi:unnamed protein product, partial [Closterium sp. NIES-53]